MSFINHVEAKVIILLFDSFELIDTDKDISTYLILLLVELTSSNTTIFVKLSMMTNIVILYDNVGCFIIVLTFLIVTVIY